MRTYLIDDDFISIFVTEKALVNENFSDEITSFTSAEEALASIKKEPQAKLPDIIFLDLNMPGMNGWDFLNALEPYKKMLQDKCPIYILTSSLDLADSERAERYSLVSGFIHKPLDPDDVKTIVYELNNRP